MDQETDTEKIGEKKERVMADLEKLISNNFIKKEEVLSLLGEKKEPEVEKEGSRKVVDTLYFIGGIIIILGLGVFIWQFWSHWTQGIKVIFALGLTSILYGIGYYLNQNYEKLSIFSNISFVLSVLLLPLGIGTFLDLIGASSSTSSGLSINFAVLAIMYFISYLTLKYDVFVVFAILAAAALFVAFTNFLVGDQPTAVFYEYRILILGIAFLSLGYNFESYKKHLVNIFYLFGLAFLLGSSFALSLDSTLWLLLFPLLLAGAFYGSIALNNRLILALATVFTFVEIGRLTAEYFSQSLGWPLALMIAGFVIILVGYLSYEVGRKYIKKQGRQ
ncbi:MAG: DUF2157 domain-containing protein [Candidatus Nealsonbacteria bacterium]